MIPPVLRPSSLPALAKCPRYSPDQSEGEQQKSDGTKRHTALARYLVDDPGWKADLGEWDADGVEWAGEYIRTHAAMNDFPLEIEESREVMLESFETLRGTPDVACGPVLFDLKGRDIDSYREQMAGYVVLRDWLTCEIHVLYATERRAHVFRLHRDEAVEIVDRIAEAVANPESKPTVCDFCGWCANRWCCPAFNATGQAGARALGLTIPAGYIEDITDADGLRQLKEAAEIVAEWAKSAKAHVNEMAFRRGVVASGYRIAERKGAPSIPDAWPALQASGLTPEQAAPAFTLRFGDLAEAYATANGIKEAVAKRDLKAKLGPLMKRGANVQYLKSE